MAFDTDDETRSKTSRAGSQPPAARAGGRSWLLPLGVGVVLGVGGTALVLSQRADAPNAVAAEPPPSAAARTVHDVPREPPPVAHVEEAPRAAPSSAAAPVAPANDPPPNAAPANEAAVARAQANSPRAEAAAAATGQPKGALSSAERASSAAAAAAPKPAAASAAQPTATSVAKPPPSAATPPPSPAAAKPPQPSAAATPSKVPVTEEEKLAAAAVVTTPAENVMDEMIDDALAHPKNKGERATASAPAAVPVAPTRDDVVKAMGTLVPAIRGCAQGQSGLAPMTIVVKNDGHVESAALSGGPFQGTASGGCMEGVVRRARFPRFQQASFRVQFPFAIQ